MERGTEHAKKEAKEQVPGDRVKDAPAMARELRWRVRLANGYTSDEDSKHRRKASTAAVSSAVHHNSAVKKRKRTDEDGDAEETNSTFMHFKPRAWDAVAAHPAQREQRSLIAPRPTPDTADWTKEWVEWKDVTEGSEGGLGAVVEQRKDVIVKVRRTEKGVERQRVERVLEDWTWTDGIASSPEKDPDTLLSNGHIAKPEPVETVDVTMDTNGTS